MAVYKPSKGCKGEFAGCDVQDCPLPQNSVRVTERNNVLENSLRVRTTGTDMKHCEEQMSQKAQASGCVEGPADRLTAQAAATGNPFDNYRPQPIDHRDAFGAIDMAQELASPASTEDILLLRMFSCPVGELEILQRMPGQHSLPIQHRQASSILQGLRSFNSCSTPSTASSHWQFQVWPQPVFKMQTDVLEDDATSPFSTSPPRN